MLGTCKSGNIDSYGGYLQWFISQFIDPGVSLFTGWRFIGGWFPSEVSLKHANVRKGGPHAQETCEACAVGALFLSELQLRLLQLCNYVEAGVLVYCSCVCVCVSLSASVPVSISTAFQDLLSR